MPTTTTSVSFTAHRRLLNYLYDLNRGKRTITALMDAVGVSFDDVDALHRADMIHGVTAWTGGAPVEVGALTQAQRDMISLSLTAKGRAWVATDPLNKLLRAIRAESRRQISLLDAVRATDKALVRSAWEWGAVSVHFAGDGQETRLTDYDFQHARDYVVRLTVKGTHALGPQN